MTLSPAQHDSAFAAFERAVAAAGSQSELARLIGCTPANVHQLLKARRLLSARFVIAAEVATGISRHELRPDLYPADIPPPPVAQQPAGQPPASTPRPLEGEEAGGSSAQDPLKGLAA